MGSKANCILLSERGDAVFSTFHEHQPERARELLAQLNLDWVPEGTTDFNEAIYLPDRNKYGIGAYDGGLILCGMEIDHPEKNSTLEIVQALYRLYPSATILELGLHSAVNFFHYKLWIAGQVKRHFAGSADDGVTADVGELLPIEKPHFERSQLRDGERIFFVQHGGHTHEYDVAAYGEELLFDVAGMLLGERLDGFEGEQLEIELFAAPRRFAPSSWWKFWKVKS